MWLVCKMVSYNFSVSPSLIFPVRQAKHSLDHGNITGWHLCQYAPESHKYLMFAGSVLLVDAGNFRMKVMGGAQGATRYPQRIVAGTGSELRGGVPFPSTIANAHEAALGQVLGLTADTRRSRNATQDVYFTERVSRAKLSNTQALVLYFADDPFFPCRALAPFAACTAAAPIPGVWTPCFPPPSEQCALHQQLASTHYRALHRFLAPRSATYLG